MRTAGIVLLVLGIVGTLIFGIQAFNNSESFSFLGLDIVVSQANWTPVIISAIVLLLGIIFISVGKKATS